MGKPVKLTEAQKRAAVRVGAFTVLALSDDQDLVLVARRLLTGGYRVQSTAHFVVYRNATADQFVLLHRFKQEDLDANLLRWLNDELAPLGILTSAKDYGALLFAILASPFPPPRDQRAIWRHFCLTTLLRLRELMSHSSPSERDSHLAAFAAIYRRVGELAVGQSVLDVGSSFGFLPILLAERLPQGRIVGCDNNADLLPLASDLARVSGVSHVMFQLADVLTADFLALGTFETVTALHLLEHLTEEELPIALRHLLAVTTHRLLIAVPYEQVVQPLYGHRQAFTPDTLRQWGAWCVAALGGAAISWCEEVMGGLLIVERRGGQG
jgi:2-polyprenyl-3-methyl-5-hydroxy-6-metoxy-1,4-benzoquinol methylase